MLHVQGVALAMRSGCAVFVAVHWVKTTQENDMKAFLKAEHGHWQVEKYREWSSQAAGG
jgi:hypothetical protein